MLIICIRVFRGCSKPNDAKMAPRSAGTQALRAGV